MDNLNQDLTSLLRRAGLDNSGGEWGSRILLVAGIVLICYLAVKLFRHLVTPALQRISAQTRTMWDDHLFDDKVLHAACRLIPPVLLYLLLPLAFGDDPSLLKLLHKGCSIYLIVVTIALLNTFLSALYDISNKHETLRDRPLKGIYQMLKLVTVSVGIVLIIGILIDRNATSILAGLGASAAVLMLIFRDSILGFVSGIQLAANDMLKVGDWISIPKYGADGNVEEVSLTTVKIRNWDNTLVMLPPYLLTTDSFTNWHAMQLSGGRRVMRSVAIDMTSVRFCTPEMLDHYRTIDLIRDYVDQTERRVEEYNAAHGIGSGERRINGLHQTNLGVFRAYLVRYLRNEVPVNKDMTLMVRQLQPTETGLPMQLYFFTDTVVWVDYEGIQSDVFDHVLAVIPEFGLRVFQNPSGEDVASLRNAFFPNAQTPSQTPPQASPQASSQAAPQNAPPLHASRPAAPQRPQAEQPAPEEAKAPASASPE